MDVTKHDARIVLLGKIPPPFGGVNVSIESYHNALSAADIEVSVVNPSSLLTVLLDSKVSVIHSHFSIPFKRAFVALTSRLAGKRVFFTIHGNQFDSSILFNKGALRLAHGVITLNEDVFSRLSKLHHNVKLFSPLLSNSIDATGENRTKKKRRKSLLLYANGKTRIAGQEVYGVGFILKALPRLKQLSYSLEFIDPSGCYANDIQLLLGDPCFSYVNYAIDLKKRLEEVEVYVRPTSTDGQSITVLEALMAGCQVIASDAVPRPKGVRTYRLGDQDSFLEALATSSLPNDSTVTLTTVEEYLGFINS